MSIKYLYFTKTYGYAIPITNDKNSRKIIELNPDSDDHDFCMARPGIIKRKPPPKVTPPELNLPYDTIHLQPKTLVNIKCRI